MADLHSVSYNFQRETDKPVPVLQETGEFMAEIKQQGPYEYELMEDGNARIRRYTGNECHVAVPNEFEGHPVTQIGMASFRDCSNLQSITLPKDLIYIGVHAFLSCTSLAYAELPDRLECIAMGAFRDCDCMEQLIIPESVCNIGSISVFPQNCQFKLIVKPGSPAEKWALGHGYYAAGKSGDLNVLQRKETEEPEPEPLSEEESAELMARLDKMIKDARDELDEWDAARSS